MKKLLNLATTCSRLRSLITYFKKGTFMKLTIASLMLLAATSLFANSIHTYVGVSPLQGKACSVQIYTWDNGNLYHLSMGGDYQSKNSNGEYDIVNDDSLKLSFSDGTDYAGGIAQTPTISSNRILYKAKSNRGKNVIDFKGQSLSELKSLSYTYSYSRFENVNDKFNCNDLKLTSSSSKPGF